MKSLILVMLLAASISTKDCKETPVPEPTPTPVIEPTPTPTPVPTPTPIVSCSFPQNVPDSDFKEVQNPKTLSSVVDSIIRSLATCSGETDCTFGSEDPQVYLTAIINEAIKQGFCAGQHRNGSSDQISIAKSCTPETIWENYQPVNFGGTNHKARFAPGNIMSGWVIPVGCSGTNPVPVPTPTPIPGLVCNDFTGFRDIKVQSRVGNRININTTPQGCNKDKCNELGWTGRNCCPLGTFQGTQEACELELVGSSVFSLISDSPIASVNSLETNPTSPFLGIMKVTSDFSSAVIKVCGQKNKDVCTNGTIQ